MKKVLIIASNRENRSPGQRFRFEQYLAFLKENGFECELSFLLNAKDDKIFYGKGNQFKKALILLKCYSIRYKNLRNIRKYDIVFVYREALFTRSIYFEKQMAKHAKMIFDFDDSVWLQNVSDANKRFAFLKNADKTKHLIQLSDVVFAGNEYLANYARAFNSNVKIVPTTIDTLEYTPLPKVQKDTVTIGWSGSITTIQHFEYAINALKVIKTKYGSRVEITVIGDKYYVNQELGIKGLPWRKETEIEELCSFDIGIMPLPDDEWAKGKCGLKGLQYMALEIPTIMSPVGVNTDIIQDGLNGFLATTEEEWITKLSLLIDNEAMRLEIGKNGRETVLKSYSVDAVKHSYLTYFRELVD
jgi:glycosyltransferase involved in cell wall biosynthesis